MQPSLPRRHEVTQGQGKGRGEKQADADFDPRRDDVRMLKRGCKRDHFQRVCDRSVGVILEDVKDGNGTVTSA